MSDRRVAVPCVETSLARSSGFLLSAASWSCTGNGSGTSSAATGVDAIGGFMLEGGRKPAGTPGSVCRSGEELLLRGLGGRGVSRPGLRDPYSAESSNSSAIAGTFRTRASTARPFLRQGSPCSPPSSGWSRHKVRQGRTEIPHRRARRALKYSGMPSSTHRVMFFWRSSTAPPREAASRARSLPASTASARARATRLTSSPSWHVGYAPRGDGDVEAQRRSQGMSATRNNCSTP